MQKAISELIRNNSSAFYVFDIKALRDRISCLRSSLPKDISLCYAVKANTFISGEIINDVERFEICSPGEYYICRELGIDSKKMVISGVYKTPAVIEEMVADPDFEGIFTAESVRQYQLLCDLSMKYNRRLRVIPRLTNGSQFGMDITDLEAVVRDRKKHENIELIGIQYFSGTQKTSLKKYKRELEALDELLTALNDKYSFIAEELEYGTGFPVSYFRGEELDEESLLKGFSELIEAMSCKPRIVIELGRSIAASCGAYYTHIVDIKHNKGQSYAITDGGMHQLVYYGQYMAMKQPFVSVVGKENAPSVGQWIICGSLCTMNDIIVKQAELPDIEVGDTLCFERTGAYCMTEGISLLLSRELPSVYILAENGEAKQVRGAFETRQLNMPYYERKY